VTVYTQGFTVEYLFGSWNICLDLEAIFKYLEPSEHYLSSFWSCRNLK